MRWLVSRLVLLLVLSTATSCGRFGFAEIADGSGSNGDGGVGPDALMGAIGVQPLYQAHADWNMYVSNAGGGGTAATRPDLDCMSGSSYFTCLHAGELRTFVADGQHACAGLTAADDLGAFEWTCSGDTDPVTFYSTKLAAGKGLRDLVSASAWLPNRVVVSATGQPVFQTPSSVWWANPVTPLPTNPTSADAPIALTATGTIYTQTGDTTTSGYALDGSAADGIAIVTLGSAALSYSGYGADWCADPAGTIASSGGSAAIVCAGDVAFAWIEASFVGANRDIGNAVFFGDEVDVSRIHDTEVDGAQKIANGITLTTTTNVETSVCNLIDHSAVHDVTAVGFNTLEQSAEDTIMDSIASHNGSDGFWLGAHSINGSDGSRKVMYGNLAADNGGAGANVDLFDERFFVIQQISANNAGSGLTMAGNYGDYLAITATQNGSNQLAFPVAGNPFDETFTNVALVAANDTTIGMWLQSDNEATITDALAAHSSIGIDAIATLLTFGGDLLVGENNSDCENPGDNASLTNTCQHGSGDAIAPITGVEPATAFVGLVTADDSSNASAQTGGTAGYPPSDWTTFASPFRAWGVGGASPLFAAGLGGPCTLGGSCQIYDWSLRATDTQLLDHFGAFPTGGGACPTAIDASNAANVITDYNTPAFVFLRSAIEVMDPWLNPNGNYNGLCESNEVCIYTPNLGAYQGTGDLTTRTCGPFVGGHGVTGVTMYAYPDNGM